MNSQTDRQIAVDRLQNFGNKYRPHILSLSNGIYPLQPDGVLRFPKTLLSVIQSWGLPYYFSSQGMANYNGSHYAVHTQPHHGSAKYQCSDYSITCKWTDRSTGRPTHRRLTDTPTMHIHTYMHAYKVNTEMLKRSYVFDWIDYIFAWINLNIIAN